MKAQKTEGDGIKKAAKSRSNESQQWVEKKGQAEGWHRRCKDQQEKPRTQMEAFDKRRKCGLIGGGFEER